MPQLQVGRDTLHVDEHGTGAPVVALHSSGLSALQWRMLRGRLERTHRVLAPDLAGYGRSSPFDPARMDQFETAEDVAAAEAVVRFAGAPVHLVGHSYGGLLALRVALEGRVPVASLALFEPVAFDLLRQTAHPEAAVLSELSADGRFFALGDDGLDGFMRRFVGWWQGEGAWDALPAPSRAAMLKTAAKTYAEVRALLSYEVDLAALAALRVPTLVIAGEESPAAAVAVCRALAKALPDARLDLVPGAGHMGPLTHVRAVNELIAAHVSAH